MLVPSQVHKDSAFNLRSHSVTTNDFVLGTTPDIHLSQDRTPIGLTHCKQTEKVGTKAENKSA